MAQWTGARAPSENGNSVTGLAFYSYASTNTLPDNAPFYSAAAGFFAGGNAVADLAWKSNPDRGHLYGTLSLDVGPAWVNDGGTIWIESDNGGDFAKKLDTESTGCYGAADLLPPRY